MSYDHEKYRMKREKVLGVRKRGLSFTSVVLTVALTFVIGMGFVVVPRSIAYFNARNLDDAIYKLSGNGSLSPDLLGTLRGIDGIEAARLDRNGQRLVVTFNRLKIDTDNISALLKADGLRTILLNRVGHSVQMHAMTKGTSSETL